MINNNKNSMISNLEHVHCLVKALDDAVIALDRANIVRACSCIQYSLADLLEHALPDGYIVEVKPFNQ